MESISYIDNWKLFIQNIFLQYPRANVFLTGGSVIGLLLLKKIYNAKKFNTSYKDFEKMNLIKDYDFVLECEECCTQSFYYEFGKKFDITLNGYTGTNIRIVKKKLLNVMRSSNNNLFEMAVCVKNSCFELPLTSMKIVITNDNITYLFGLIEKIYNNTLCQNDLCLLQNVNIDIPICNDGLYYIDKLDSCNLSSTIINVIDNITTNNNQKQCLYYLVKNPTNLSRLKWKNIPKSNEIKQFYKSHFNSILPQWLINDNIVKLVDKLIKYLGILTNNIYFNHKINIDEAITKINELEREYMIFDCGYDLVGIGGSPQAVINNFNNNVVMNTFYKLSAERIEQIKLKCEKFDVTFTNDMMGVNYGKLKRDKKNEIVDEMNKLVVNYLLLFEDWFRVFNGMNITRWKDNIKLYRTLDIDDPMLCITKIFNFNIMTKLSFLDLQFNTSELSKNSIWSLIIELYRTNK